MCPPMPVMTDDEQDQDHELEAETPSASGSSDDAGGGGGDDEEEEQAGPGGAPPAAAPAAPLKPLDPQVAAMLQKKMLAQAQSKANVNQLLAGLGRAASTFSQSAHGNTAPVNNSAFDALDQAAQAPVNQVLQSQKSEAQAAQTAVQTNEAKRTAALTDPTSPQSQAVQNTIKKLYPGKFTDDQLKAVSAADAQDIIFKPLELDEKVKERQEEHSQLADDRSDRQSEKEDAKKTQSYNQTVQFLETLRSSPAAGQAEKDIYAAQKASQVLKTAAPDGDLNNLSQPQVAMFVSELGKIASGGQASEAELNAITPSTLQGALRSEWSKLSNSPTPANLGAFLKQYKAYADGVTRDAQQVIQDRYGRIINTRKSQFSPEQYQSLQDNYLNRFSPGTSPASQQQFTPDVVSYAQKHGITNDQALAIKRQRTGG